MDLVNDAPNVSFEIEHIEQGEWFLKPKSYAHFSFLQSKLLGAKLLLLIHYKSYVGMGMSVLLSFAMTSWQICCFK